MYEPKLQTASAIRAEWIISWVLQQVGSMHSHNIMKNALGGIRSKAQIVELHQRLACFFFLLYGSQTPFRSANQTSLLKTLSIKNGSIDLGAVLGLINPVTFDWLPCRASLFFLTLTCFFSCQPDNSKQGEDGEDGFQISVVTTSASNGGHMLCWQLQWRSGRREQTPLQSLQLLASQRLS